MKRILPILLPALLLAALFAGCAKPAAKMPTDDVYHPETDHPYSAQTDLKPTLFVEADKGYYFRLKDTLLYMDRDKMDPIPVCGKPNCLHNDAQTREEFEACNACFGAGTLSQLGWYNDAVYLLAKVVAERDNGTLTSAWAVMRVSPDGSQRRTLWMLGEVGTDTMSAMIFHRGVFYLASEVRDEQNAAHCRLLAYPLDKPGQEPEVLYEAVSEADGNGIRYLTAYGNRLYFVRPSEEHGRELCIVDIRTRELTVITDPDPALAPLFMTFNNGKLLVESRSYYLQEGDEGRGILYRCELDGSGMEPVDEGFGIYAADEKYIYKAPVFWTEGEKDPLIRIYDAGMNELDRIDLRDLADMGQISGVSCVGGSGGQAFLILRVKEASGIVFHYYWFSKAEISSGNIELHAFVDDDMETYSMASIDKRNKSGGTTTAAATTAATTTAAATTAAASIAAGPSAPVTTAPVRTPAAHWDTGSITVENLGLDLEDKAVEFMCSVPQEGFDERLGAWETAAQYISETYMGEVTLTPLTYTDYLTALRKRQAAGDAPDVFPVENVSGNKLPELIRKGQIIPLDAYIPACMPRSFARVDERLYETVKMNGSVFGILSLSEALLGTQTLYYDKSLTDAAGITVGDWTRMSDNWETFYAMREWLDANRPDLHDTPVAAVDITWANEGLFELFGGSNSCAGAMYPGYETDGAASSEVLSIYETQGFYEYLLDLRQLKIDRILPEDWTFLTQEEQKEAYSGAEGVVFLSEPAGTGENWAKSIQSTAFCSTESVTGPALVVSADSDAPDAACKLIEVLNCDRYVGTTLRLGEEGIDWTMNADGQAVIRRDLGMWGSGMLGDVTNCVIPATEAADYAAQLEARMANAVVSENLGFRLDRNRNLNWHALSRYYLKFKEKLMATYLGMGTGQEIAAFDSDGVTTHLGYDIHVGYLLDCTQTQEELERQYSAFSGLLKSDHAEIYEAKTICAEVQRQLDAWRAERQHT